ncbi:hypothetical protein GWK47_035774 [Chionoecetes opilio]|uniref:Integrase catalytic domain-containing protein n=1 Tax=Chionoecetes opilio TaxID=41210 RepID=A0A8J4YGG6_CHIOP|nr:hypothetical protein GWK47_035774 [Chionoecetes opilio]
MPEKLTRRTVFSLCGELTSHLPVCGWLRVAASYLKRRANAATTSWEDEVTDSKLRFMIEETLKQVKRSDPARGRWDVKGDENSLWVDASSLALGALLEVNVDVIEDACWLRRDECSHINLAELDAVIKGLNLAIAWKMSKLTIMTDSRTVYYWVKDTLSKKARVKTKASSEMLIRRRLETLRAIVEEYGLSLDIRFVSSAENKADALTRVPKRLRPSRYAIWRGIRRQDTASVTEQLESVFLERGAPKELLTDNATSFRSSLFGEFANRWGIAIRYRCAHVPSGNGISERCHRTVKTILARKGCSVAEAVYRYNVMPRGNDAASAPANQIFRYEVRLLGIDEVRQQNQSADDQHRYSVGDRVWIRHPSRRCNSRSLEGTVTRLVSPQNVEVDGMPRHVRDLRWSLHHCPPRGNFQRQSAGCGRGRRRLVDPGAGPCEGSEDEGTIEEGADSPERPQLRRGSRERRPTQLCQYSDL